MRFKLVYLYYDYNMLNSQENTVIWTSNPDKLTRTSPK